MFQKFKNILCHPAYFGMYLMDKWYQALGWVFGFFLFTTILLAAKDMHTSTISDTGVTYMAAEILAQDDLQDTVFANGHLSGTQKKFYVSSGLVYFNLEGYNANGASSGLIFVFMTDKAMVYYSKFKLGEISYSSMNVDDFTFASIKNGSQDDIIAYKYLVGCVVRCADKNYRGVTFFQNFLLMMVCYVLSFAITYFTAFLTNPVIERKIRLKLVAYDSISFFTVMIFGILFGISWFTYVGMGMGFVYAGRTFMHIKRISVRKGGNGNDNQGEN